MDSALPSSAKSELTRLFYELLDAAMELQGADFGHVHLYDKSMEKLKIVAHRGVDQEFLDYFATIDASNSSASGMALRTGARIIIEDVTTYPGYEPHAIATSTGYRGVQATPLCDRDSGKPIGMLTTLFRKPYRPSMRELRLIDLYARQAADVLALKLTQQRLRESEGWMLAILSQVPGALGLFDLEGRMLWRGGPLSSLWSDVIPSRDSVSTWRWRSFDSDGRLLSPSQFPGARALRGETVTPGIDFLYTAEDGRETWIRVSAAPFRDDAGKIAGAIGILQTVDAEKRAKQRLAESEARLQAAVHLVKLGLYTWNPQTNELLWDETVKALWGLPGDAPIDYDIWRAGVHPDDLARVGAAVRRASDPTGDGLYDIEYRVIGITDGVERWIATRGQTQFEDDKPVSFHGLALDVTDRKLVENALGRRVEARSRELAEANRQLHSQVEQRETAEAMVQQLQRLDAIGQLTSGVAHDFNNLLSVVLMNARLLSRKARDAADQERLSLIHNAAERGAKLTSQLLAFSRKQRLEPQIVDLNSKIAEMDDLLGVTLGEMVHLKTNLAPYLWPALVDPVQIEAVLLNLVINGRDALPSGGGTVTIETSNAIVDDEPSRPEEPPPGDYVKLAVGDTGVGIPDDVLPRIFEPFFTTKRSGRGSGLGLAQVFGFTKQSGGGVRVETRVGEGTTVTVFLPRGEIAATDQEEEYSVTAGVLGRRRKCNVLVIDDDKAVLNSTIGMLESLGHSVVSAQSGAEALQLMSAKPDIGLVLADFAMPEMNGIELASAIRAMRPALPIILITGYGDSDILKAFGDSRILQKPFNEDELVDKIGEALG